ncbi:MAG: putative addiction module antidote protein [bacterium]|jgi:probable addiction module antidote protein
MKVKDFRKDYLEKKLEDPIEMEAYKEAVFEAFGEDGDIEDLKIAMGTIIKVSGGVSDIAKKAKINRQNIYKALSEQGNPTIKTIDLILRNLGYKLSVSKIKNNGSVIS